jgi:hypothetical protein
VKSLVQAVSPDKSAIPRRENQSSPLSISTTASVNVLAHAARPDFNPPLPQLVVQEVYDQSGSRRVAEVVSSMGMGGSYAKTVNLPPETKLEAVDQGYAVKFTNDYMYTEDNAGRYDVKSCQKRMGQGAKFHPVVVSAAIELNDAKLNTGAQQRPLVLRSLASSPLSCLKLNEAQQALLRKPRLQRAATVVASGLLNVGTDTQTRTDKVQQLEATAFRADSDTVCRCVGIPAVSGAHSAAHPTKAAPSARAS